MGPLPMNDMGSSTVICSLFIRSYVQKKNIFLVRLPSAPHIAKYELKFRPFQLIYVVYLGLLEFHLNKGGEGGVYRKTPLSPNKNTLHTTDFRDRLRFGIHTCQCNNDKSKYPSYSITDHDNERKDPANKA